MLRRFTLAIAGAALLAQAGVAVATDHAAVLTAECHKQLNLGPTGCACIGERAGEVLNEKQQALVVAMVTKDQAASTQARGDMTMEEITGAAKFMMDAPKHCAGQ